MTLRDKFDIYYGKYLKYYTRPKYWTCVDNHFKLFMYAYKLGRKSVKKGR